MVTASDSDSEEDDESRPEPLIKPASSSSSLGGDTKKASVLTTDRGASITALGAGRCSASTIPYHHIRTHNTHIDLREICGG